MIRIVLAASNRAKKTSTATTIRLANWTSSFGHQRGGATDLDHSNLLARLQDLLVEACPGTPDLASDADLALVGADALDHHRLAADQRSRPGADLRGNRDVTAGDRPGDAQGGDRRDQEDDELDRRARAEQRDEECHQGPESERSEKEASGQHLAGAED